MYVMVMVWYGMEMTSSVIHRHGKAAAVGFTRALTPYHVVRNHNVLKWLRIGKYFIVKKSEQRFSHLINSNNSHNNSHNN